MKQDTDGNIINSANNFAVLNEDNINYGNYWIDNNHLISSNTLSISNEDYKPIRFNNCSNPYLLLNTIGKTIRDFSFMGTTGIMRINFTDGTSIDFGVQDINSLQFNEAKD